MDHAVTKPSRILKIDAVQRLFLLSILEKNKDGDVSIYTVKKTDFDTFDGDNEKARFASLREENIEVDDVIFWNGEYLYVEQIEEDKVKGTIIWFSIIPCFPDFDKKACKLLKTS